jgi:hypothetical protein
MNRRIAALLVVATVVVHLSRPADANAAGTIWVSRDEAASLAQNGPAWDSLFAEANRNAGNANLADKQDRTNVRVLAKAIVYAATAEEQYAVDVESILVTIADGVVYSGSALSLGRELGAYVISADIIDLAERDPALDARFRAKLDELRMAPTSGGPLNLIHCHETRANNWGTQCGASRIAVALYLDDRADLDRAATVFKGWLGDRASYSGFRFGNTSWQAAPAAPVGINPRAASIEGHDVGGVLPDDQRRGGLFSWPPPREDYVYEALQGALAQAVMLSRAGYDVWNWEDRALLRAFEWLHKDQFLGGGAFEATGDDQWQPHVVNHYYGTSFPAPVPAEPGKNVGWTDWTLSTEPEGLCERALRTLRVSLGLGACSLARCDADHDGHVTVQDALVFLRSCVGL